MGKTESKPRSNDISPTLFTARDNSPGVAPMSAVMPCSSPLLRQEHNAHNNSLSNSCQALISRPKSPSESHLVFDQQTKLLEYKKLCLPFSKLWMTLSDCIKQRTMKRIEDDSGHHFLLAISASQTHGRIFIYYSGRISLMNIYTGAREATIDHPYQNMVNNFLEIPEKRILLSTDSQAIRVWDLSVEKTITLQKEIRSRYPEILNMQNLKNGFVAGSRDSTIHVFNIEEALQKPAIGFFTCHHSTFSDTVFFQTLSNGAKIVANYPGDCIKIWDWSKEKCIKTFNTQNLRRIKGISDGHYLKEIQLVQDRYIPIFGSDSMAVWLDLQTEEIIKRRNTELAMIR